MSIPRKMKAVARAEIPAVVPPPAVAERKRRVSKEVSVMGWIENIYGDVLMVKQKRGRKLWSLPGGKIEPAEALEQGLIREVREETALRVKYCDFIGILDRPEKSNLTILYRVIVHAGASPVPQRSEISQIEFRSTLPRDSTPSLKHFWRLMRVGAGHSRR